MDRDQIYWFFIQRFTVLHWISGFYVNRVNLCKVAKCGKTAFERLLGVSLWAMLALSLPGCCCLSRCLRQLARVGGIPDRLEQPRFVLVRGMVHARRTTPRTGP